MQIVFVLKMRFKGYYKEVINYFSLCNQTKNQTLIEMKNKVKEKLFANSGQNVLQEMIVICFIKNQIALFFQNAIKETNVNSITGIDLYIWIKMRSKTLHILS